MGSSSNTTNQLKTLTNPNTAKSPGTALKEITSGGPLADITGGASSRAFDQAANVVEGKGIKIPGLDASGIGPAKTTPPSGGFNASRDINASAYTNAAPVNAPQATAFTSQGSNIDQSASNQSRGYQNFLAQQLQAQVQGLGGPSVAQQQLAQNANQSALAQQAVAASARGNLGAARREAAMNQGQLGAQFAQQNAQLGQQNMLNAQNQLGSVASQLRGTDASLANQQAQLTQANNQFNATAGQQNAQFNAQQQAQLQALQQKYQSLGLSAEQANQAADTALRNAIVGQAQAAGGIMTQNTAAQNAFNGALLNTAGTLGAAGYNAYVNAPTTSASQTPMSVQESSNLLPATPNAGYAYPTAGQSAGLEFDNAINPTGVSDKKAKKNIKSGHKAVKEFLDAVTVHTYNYKK